MLIKTTRIRCLRFLLYFAQFFLHTYIQGRSEETAIVVFEILIINCQIDFINLFVFKGLTFNINLLIFNCLMSNFCFSKNMFCKQKRTKKQKSRRERLFMDPRPQFQILNSPGKTMTCYLRDRNTFLRYPILCTSILKCGFSTRGIKLTRLVLFEALGVSRL